MEFSKKFVSECLEYSTYEKNIPAPLFRKSFILKSKADSAKILICGLGFYELFINGRKITKGHIAPYVSNPDHYTYFDEYDILPYLNIGENVFGVMLGDGFLVGKTLSWDINKNITNSAPMLALSTLINCGDECIEFEADDFVCKKGPIIFNDFRSGVFYDARLEEKGWNEVGFVEKDWHVPIVVSRPRGKAKLCSVEPIKIYKEIKPVSIRKGEMEECNFHKIHRNTTSFEAPVPVSGGYIYDFGENNAGIYRLKIKGKRGQKINLQFAEQVCNGKLSYNNMPFCQDGFAQRDIYYVGSEDEEIFEPMFTFHGYRYIYVEGITEEQATEELLTYLVMSSELNERGTFECSDERANAIYKMGRRSDISNFFYFPLDCPHREKNGWTGDASVSAEHMIMTLSVEKSWREWLNNVRAAQTEEGQLPGIVPTAGWGYKWGNGPAWDSVIFNLPYFAYKYRGDTEIIVENATAMLRYLEYISKKRDERGIVELGLGDWVPVNKECHEYDADLGFTDSVMVLDMCRKASVMFDKVGLSHHRTFADALGKEFLESIRNEYIDWNTYVVKNKCQTSQAMALYYDVFTDEEKHKGFDVLMNIIHEDENKFTCGFLGMRVLFHILAQHGEADLAYDMITRSEFTSYGYWLDKGETTFLEHFFDYDEYFRESKNHHFLGDVVNWFMSNVGGLRVQHNNYVTINPKFIQKLNWCRTSMKLSGGNIEIEWKRNKDSILLDVRTTGEVNYSLHRENTYEYEFCEQGQYTLRQKK